MRSELVLPISESDISRLDSPETVERCLQWCDQQLGTINVKRPAYKGQYKFIRLDERPVGLTFVLPPLKLPQFRAISRLVDEVEDLYYLETIRQYGYSGWEDYEKQLVRDESIGSSVFDSTEDHVVRSSLLPAILRGTVNHYSIWNNIPLIGDVKLYSDDITPPDLRYRGYRGYYDDPDVFLNFSELFSESPPGVCNEWMTTAAHEWLHHLLINHHKNGLLDPTSTDKDDYHSGLFEHLEKRLGI